MKKIGYEFWCRECGFEAMLEHAEYECPECGSVDVYNSRFITCDCGTAVSLGGFTNECPECGQLYNSFGQMLAPVEEWDEEDRYACFSPQNCDDDCWA